MATLNFPDAPSTGDVYKDGNSGFSYEWNGTVWISTDPSTASNIRELDNISSGFNGSTTAFTLQVSSVNVEPANVQQLIISVGGVMQNAGTDFTLSGSTLTFTTAPSSGLTFFGVLLGTALSLNTVANGSVGSAALKTEDFTIGGSGNTVTIPGNLTVQGTETIINTERLDIQDKTVGIASTNAPTSASQDDAGIIIYGQTHINALYDVDKAALGISTAVNVSGFVTATRAQVGTGVTINNTGIDLGIGGVGVVTASRIAGAGLTIADGRALVGIDTSEPLFYTGRVQVQGTNSSTSAITVKTNQNDSGGPAIVLGKSRAASAGGVTIVQDDDELGCLYFTGADGVDCTSQAAFIRGSVDGTPGSNDMPGRLIFGTAADGAATGTERLRIHSTGQIELKVPDSVSTLKLTPSGTNASATIDFSTPGTGSAVFKVQDSEKLRITSGGGFQFSNGLFDEKVNITAGKLSANLNIDLANGMVHYFTTQEDATALPNIRIDASNTLQDAMGTGDVCTVTLITTAAAAGYAANLTIDGNAVTEEWVGGEAPSEGGADGLDIYTYTIICIGTGTGDSGFKVIANLTNATN